MVILASEPDAMLIISTFTDAQYEQWALLDWGKNASQFKQMQCKKWETPYLNNIFLCIISAKLDGKF